MRVSIGVLPTKRTKNSCSITDEETVRREGSRSRSFPKRLGWLGYWLLTYSSRAHWDFSCRLSMWAASDRPQASEKHTRTTLWSESSSLQNPKSQQAVEEVPESDRIFFVQHQPFEEHVKQQLETYNKLFNYIFKCISLSAHHTCRGAWSAEGKRW